MFQPFDYVDRYDRQTIEYVTVINFDILAASKSACPASIKATPSYFDLGLLYSVAAP